MAANSCGVVRLYGDPFAAVATAARLRRLLTLVTDRGQQAALDLTLCEGDPAGERSLQLTDGCNPRMIHTSVTAPELDLILRACGTEVPGTAPCVVFCGADGLRQAGLQYPHAVALMDAGDQDPEELLARLPWLASGSCPIWRPAPVGPGPVKAFPDRVLVLHHLDEDRTALPLVLDALVRTREKMGLLFELALFGPGAQGSAAELVGSGIHVRAGTPDDIQVGLCYLQPWRKAPQAVTLRSLLETGCPVVMSRWSATAGSVPGPGLCYPIGGRRVPAAAGERNGGPGFEPNLDHVAATLARLLDRPAEAAAVADRARRHVHRSGGTGPEADPPHVMPLPVGGHAMRSPAQKPVLVLEAPMFQVDSSSVLTIATARALRRRGLVDLHLVPSRPEIGRYADLKRWAPDLVPYLTTRPPMADLWLSAGWPPRTDRPQARRFAVRFDYEYGALPADLQPLLTEEADQVVVHSNAVARILEQAGTPGERICRIPHGVETCFTPEGDTDPEVSAFAAGAPTFLFVGGLIWRKGVDRLLQAWLTAFRGRDVRLVIKSGGQGRYRGFGLDALVRRCAGATGAPPLLLMEQDMTVERLAALYRSCDVLVHPYRGEGFGLPVLEARASGLPVVVTAGGATDDFCDGDSCLKVAATIAEVALPDLHLHQPFVLEPDPGSLRLMLERAVRELPVLKQAGREASRDVRSRHGWDRAAVALEEMAGLPGPDSEVAIGPCRREIGLGSAQGGPDVGR